MCSWVIFTKHFLLKIDLKKKIACFLVNCRQYQHFLELLYIVIKVLRPRNKGEKYTLKLFHGGIVFKNQ